MSDPNITQYREPYIETDEERESRLAYEGECIEQDYLTQALESQGPELG